MPLKTEVAVKIVDLEALPNEALEEIRQQIYVMQLCNRHPNIVDYHTSFIDAHYLWVVMSYLAGGSCADIMKYGFPYGLDETSIRIILKGILKALAFFHTHGRIHRDIKASNILISDKGHVQVADFGVSACLADSQQLRTTLCGTPCWMAPEVMLLAWPKKESDKGPRGYGVAVDIWSFGITALELAKGRPPFADYPPSKVFSMIVQQPPPSLSTDDGASVGDSGPPTPTMSPNTRKKFSKNFQDLIACCLQKDPAKRPTAAKLLKHKFFSKNAKRDYLVNTLLSKLPPLGERVRMCQLPGETPPPTPVCDDLGSRFEWVFPEDRVCTLEELRAIERKYYRYARSLQSLSSSTSFASASFLSSASSSASSDSWINADVGSVEFLNQLFHNVEFE
jgi:serine/threonine-protein kinase OSR1/STK39